MGSSKERAIEQAKAAKAKEAGATWLAVGGLLEACDKEEAGGKTSLYAEIADAAGVTTSLLFNARRAYGFYAALLRLFPSLPAIGSDEARKLTPTILNRVEAACYRGGEFDGWMAKALIDKVLAGTLSSDGLNKLGRHDKAAETKRGRRSAGEAEARERALAGIALPELAFLKEDPDDEEFDPEIDVACVRPGDPGYEDLMEWDMAKVLGPVLLEQGHWLEPLGGRGHGKPRKIRAFSLEDEWGVPADMLVIAAYDDGAVETHCLYFANSAAEEKHLSDELDNELTLDYAWMNQGFADYSWIVLYADDEPRRFDAGDPGDGIGVLRYYPGKGFAAGVVPERSDPDDASKIKLIEKALARLL